VPHENYKPSSRVHAKVQEPDVQLADRPGFTQCEQSWEAARRAFLEREEAHRVALWEQRMTAWLHVLREAKEIMYSKEELDADLLMWVDEQLSAAMKELIPKTFQK